jgi:hypothetical protein
MGDARTAVGPNIVDRITRMEADLRSLIARTRRVIVEGTLTAYVADLHTATVTIGGVDYAGIPVSYGIMPYAVRAGVNVGATAGVVSFNAATPWVGCVIYITSATPPPDPFDSRIGHKHRGLTDDAPTL